MHWLERGLWTRGACAVLCGRLGLAQGCWPRGFSCWCGLPRHPIIFHHFMAPSYFGVLFAVLAVGSRHSTRQTLATGVTHKKQLCLAPQYSHLRGQTLDHYRTVYAKTTLCAFCCPNAFCFRYKQNVDCRCCTAGKWPWRPRRSPRK